MVAEGTNTTATITGLVPGTTYYFAATAEGIYGVQSPYSTEISYFVPLLPCSITMGNLNQIYNGQPEQVAVSTNPTNVAVSLTYNGSTSPPTNAGSYAVVATVISATYTGAATNTLTISPAPATVTLAGLVQSYDGSGKAVSSTTQPAGLPTTVTYNGFSSPPVDSGSYVVICSIASANYWGSTTNTLLINSAVATITLGGLSQAYDGTAKSVTVTTVPSNLAVMIGYNGSANAPVNAGSYAVTASPSDTNYIGSATSTLVVNKASASLVLSNLSQTYDGTAKTVAAVTTPTNLAVNVLYDESDTAPTNAGSYSAVASIVAANYEGTVTNVLNIAKATAAIQLSQLVQGYTGNPCQATVATVPAGLNVDVTYNGTNEAPSAIGNYNMVVNVNDTNYAGTATATFTIEQVSPPSNLIIISWTASVNEVTLLESTDLVNWVTNTTSAIVSRAASGTSAMAVPIEPGNHFFRVVSMGVGIPIRIN
jgi:hypothetical protein